MTTVQRRPAPEPQVYHRRSVHERFPKRTRVMVRPDVFGGVYSNNEGRVLRTVLERGDDIYPGGRVLVHFSREIIIGTSPAIDRAWFKPSALEKL